MSRPSKKRDLGPAAVGPWARITRTRTASVTYMNPPTWTDDELLRELSAALREPVVDEGFIRAARAGFTRRRADAGPESRRPAPAGPEP